MRVYAFESDKKGFMELENTLEAEQKFVGGLIEVVAITEHIDLVLNEEGLLLDLEPMVSLKLGENRSIVIVGNCFVCRHNRRGEFESLRDEDITVIEERLTHLDSPAKKLLGMLAAIQFA